MAKLKKKNQPADEAAGGKLRMRRKMLGMSQSSLADSVGLTFQQIQKYEKGTNRMGSSRLQQFANVLSVPVSFFFNEEPNPSKAMPAGAIDLFGTTDGLRLVKAFSRIENSKTRKRIIELVDELAG